MGIGQASIIRFNNNGKILIHSLSRTELGSIATEPFIWLDAATPDTEMTKQVVFALNSSKEGLKAPKDWSKNLKDFLNRIGLKKEDELYDNSTYVGVSMKDGMITFTPMKNMGKRKGIVNVSDVKFIVKANKSIDEISIALKSAINRCE